MKLDLCDLELLYTLNMKQQLKDRTKGKTTCSSSQSQNGSIKSFFNGTAKVKKKSVNCPICRIEVELSRINDHIDSNDCGGGSNTPATPTHDQEQDDVEVVAEHSNINQLKRKSSCDDVNNKKVKIDSDSLHDDDFMKDNEDDHLLSALCTPKKTNVGVPSKTIKLSPSVSYNPARYQGIHNLSPSPNAKIVRLGNKHAGDKYKGTPTKLKRNLIDSFLPDIPQHDPYTPSKRSDPEYVPYYVTNFEYVIRCVIDCSDDKNLFSDEELDTVDTYRSLDLDSKKLFVRLLNRRHAWLHADKIRYDEVQSHEAALATLVCSNLLDDQNKLEDIEQILTLLPVVEVKNMARDLNCSSKATSKNEIIPEILKLCRRKSGFFQTVNTLEQKLVKKAKGIINSCYKINPSVRSTLMRVLCLWGLHTWWESKEEGAAPSTLTSILLTNQGRTVYPAYKIARVAKIFRNRDDLILFEQAVKMGENIETAVLSKDFEAGYESYQTIRKCFESFDESFFDHISSLPVFLQKYTALSVIIVGLTKAVDLLEKMKKYEEAVELLNKLIDLNVLDKFRGHWYERLALDLDSHLKKPLDALNVVETALNDPKVRVGRRLMLIQRAVKICSMKKYNLEAELERFSSRPDWSCPTAEDLPTLSVHGKMLSNDTSASGGRAGKSVWEVADPDTDTVTYCSVEEFCLQHFTRATAGGAGLHAEGAVFNSLLGLLFWDVIYAAELPDVFRDPCQALPYDWDTDHFYAARRELVAVRLAEVRGWDRAQLAEAAVSAWLLHHGTVSLVSWDLFTSEDSLRQCVLCLEPLGLASVLERMLQDHRSTRSGLPDLTLWNAQERTFRMVEVKGPGDKLSTKQIVRFHNYSILQKIASCILSFDCISV